MPRLVMGVPEAAANIFVHQRVGNDGWPAQFSIEVLETLLPKGFVQISMLLTTDVFRVSNQKEPTEAILRKEWRKLGWSEAKMVRALADMSKSHSRRFHGLHAELRKRIASVARSHGPLYLYAFDLMGDQSVKDRRSVSPEDLLADSSIVRLNVLVEVCQTSAPSA